MTTKKQQDGYGNEIIEMNLDELEGYFSINNKDMWIDGDRIQVHNKEGCVINTIVVKDKRLYPFHDCFKKENKTQ